MTDKIYGGSHEVKENFSGDIHNLFDRVVDDISEEKIPREAGFHALKAATESPSVAYQMIDQYTANGALDLDALNLQQRV